MYLANDNRYSEMDYRRCGNSGLKLPAISLGLWHNFGENATKENCTNLMKTAFDNGITYFDLANNYGPPAGSAETMFGAIYRDNFKPYRDEIIVSSKAGYFMWDGPYGEWGSKKNLVSSLDQSLLRMGLDYVDIFYHHRPDPQTPIQETLGALDLIMKQGKALYVGISNYSLEQTRMAIECAEKMGMHLLCNQLNYSLLNRDVFENQQNLLIEKGVGMVAFSPLAGGRLTNRYFNGIPQDSRVKTDGRFLSEEDITPQLIEKMKKLDAIATNRQQKLSQMALSFLLAQNGVTTTLIGASKVSHIIDAIAAQKNITFSFEEIKAIEEILA